MHKLIGAKFNIGGSYSAYSNPEIIGYCSDDEAEAMVKHLQQVPSGCMNYPEFDNVRSEKIIPFNMVSLNHKYKRS